VNVPDRQPTPFDECVHPHSTSELRLITNKAFQKPYIVSSNRKISLCNLNI
jgi:hypothetical protein